MESFDQTVPSKEEQFELIDSRGYLFTVVTDNQTRRNHLQRESDALLYVHVPRSKRLEMVVWPEAGRYLQLYEKKTQQLFEGKVELARSKTGKTGYLVLSGFASQGQLVDKAELEVFERHVRRSV